MAVVFLPPTPLVSLGYALSVIGPTGASGGGTFPMEAADRSGSGRGVGGFVDAALIIPNKHLTDKPSAGVPRPQARGRPRRAGGPPASLSGAPSASKVMFVYCGRIKIETCGSVLPIDSEHPAGGSFRGRVSGRCFLGATYPTESSRSIGIRPRPGQAGLMLGSSGCGLDCERAGALADG